MDRLPRRCLGRNASGTTNKGKRTTRRRPRLPAAISAQVTHPSALPCQNNKISGNFFRSLEKFTISSPINSAFCGTGTSTSTICSSIHCSSRRSLPEIEAHPQLHSFMWHQLLLLLHDRHDFLHDQRHRDPASTSSPGEKTSDLRASSAATRVFHTLAHITARPLPLCGYGNATSHHRNCKASLHQH